MKLIGIGGLKGSGKSTVARHLARQMWDSEIYSFATPMKEMMRTLMAEVGLSEDQQESYLDNKHVPITALGGVTMRRMLQTVGTEWARDCISPDFWSEIGARRIENSRASLIIFDDIRFHNEAGMIQSKGGKIVQLHRPGTDKGDGHLSERMDYPVDLHIDNVGEPQAVAEKIWHDLGL